MNNVSYTPDDFGFIKEEHWRRCLKNAYDKISEMDFWDFMKNESPPPDTGYVFWSHENVVKIGELLDLDGHSGSSFGICMRNMEYIAKHGWDAYVIKMEKNT
jgi:hypothetical protein